MKKHKSNKILFLFSALIVAFLGASLFSNAALAHTSCEQYIPVTTVTLTSMFMGLSVLSFFNSQNFSGAFNNMGVMMHPSHMQMIAGNENIPANERLQIIANSKLSNMTGDDYDDYDDYDNYDDFDGVSFDDHTQSFTGKVLQTIFTGSNPMVDSDRLFVIQITNTNATDETIYISPSYRQLPPFYAVANGVIREGAFNAISGHALNGAAGGDITIDEFYSYIYHNPTHCFGFKYESNVKSALSKSVIVEDLTAFRRLGNKNTPISKYTDENTFKDGVATVKLSFDFNTQSEIKLQIPAGSVQTPTVCTFTFVCGPSMNNYHNLKRKIDVAKAKRPGKRIRRRK